MRLLLDTHAFLWFIAGDKQLAKFSRELIEDPSNERFLSTASLWEITIKASLGKLTVPNPPSTLVRDHVWSNAIQILTIDPEHLDVLATLCYTDFIAQKKFQNHMQSTIQSIDLISTNPNVRNGRPCIAGTSLEVAVIVTAKIMNGLDADEIAANYGLSMSQVYAALAYYYDHKPEIDASINERRELAKKMKGNRVGSRHQPLFG